MHRCGSVLSEESVSSWDFWHGDTGLLHPPKRSFYDERSSVLHEELSFIIFITAKIDIWMVFRVIATVGKKIINLTFSLGFSVQFGTALTVLICTSIGIPVSTTHGKESVPNAE